MKPSRRAGALALFALLLASCGPRDVQTPEALMGRWDGHVAWRDATTPLTLTIWREGDSLVARLAAPSLGMDSLALGRVSFDSPRVHFAVPDSFGDIAFDGWQRRGLVVGAFSGAPMGGETNPARLPQLSLKRWLPPSHKSPWPESLAVVPAPPREPQHSLSAWLAAHAGR